MYNARDLLKHSTEQLWSLISRGPHQLQFDDGTVVDTNDKEILFSSYVWDFHRRYPNTPMLPCHHVKHVLNGKTFNAGTHIKLMEYVYWDVVNYYQLHTPALRNELTKMVYEVTNNIYNDLTQKLEAYVTSLDILDFIQVIDHPEIKADTDNLTPTPVSIEKVYDTIGRVLKTDPSLSGNSLALFTRADVVKHNQVLQCVGPRGFVTEVDGDDMPVPILRSFTKGMLTLYNLSLESRAASKSLYFAEAPLQNSEYFARRLQLMTMAVEYIERGDLGTVDVDSNIRMGDCGSDDYLIWRIRGEERVNDVVVYPGDLVFMNGKYYLDEETDTLKRIGKTDYHLVDRTIKIRTVLGCHYHDSRGVCAVCFGGLADNISPHANLGHITSAMMTQQSTQSVLSTKHLMASSTSEAIILTEVGRRFFKISNKGDAYLVLPEWKNKGLKLVAASGEAYGLTDIMLVDDVDDINPSRISAIEVVEVMIGDENSRERHPIIVSQHGRKAVLTSEFLQHLKIHHWETDENNNFLFSFDKWDFNKPILRLPQKEYSFAKHASEISKIVESRVKDITSRGKPDSPKATLIELFELVNSKLFVNIACLEVIVYAVMCQDVNNDNFALGRNTPTAGLGVTDPIIHGRSLSAAYAYESQTNVILDPASFFPENRNDHVMDVFIAPAEVLAAHKK